MPFESGYGNMGFSRLSVHPPASQTPGRNCDGCHKQNPDLRPNDSRGGSVDSSYGEYIQAQGFQ